MKAIANDNPGLFTENISFLVEKNKYGSFKCQSRYKNRELFQSLFPKYKNSFFCEIGVFGGINLFGNYDEATKNNIKIIGIDPHDKIEIFNGMHKNNISSKRVNKRLKMWKNFRINIENTIKKHNLNIKYINDTSWNAYAQIEDNSIGILHVDGDHSYDGVKKDLQLFYPKMQKNSVIVMDDYKWTGIRNATHEFIKKYNFSTNEIFNGDKLIINIIK